METFSNVLRREMRQFSVKVCTIQPGNFINTTGIVGGSDVALTNINQLWDDLNVSLQESYGRQCIDDSILFTRIDVSFIGMIICNIKLFPINLILNCTDIKKL